MIFYDRMGQPITSEEFGKKFEDFNYKVVKQEYTPSKKYWISTVWLGIDHSFGGNPPLIFETMVFSGKRNHWFKMGSKRFYHREDYYQARYHTETQALKGHQLTVKEWSKK